MEKIPRHIDIDYSKYAPDIPEDRLEAYYGLPKHVQFCKECVMSNQKPNSCYEFEHTINSIKKTMVIQEDASVMPAMPATTRPTAISTGPAREGAARALRTSTARTTAAMTVWCPAPAARTASTPRTC